jgi:hypothetical protein
MGSKLFVLENPLSTDMVLEVPQKFGSVYARKRISGDSDSLDMPVLSAHQNLGFVQIFPSFQILELILCLISLRLSQVDYTPLQHSYCDRFTVILNCTSGLQLHDDSDKHASYFP